MVNRVMNGEKRYIEILRANYEPISETSEKLHTYVVLINAVGIISFFYILYRVFVDNSGSGGNLLILFLISVPHVALFFVEHGIQEKITGDDVYEKLKDKSFDINKFSF